MTSILLHLQTVSPLTVHFLKCQTFVICFQSTLKQLFSGCGEIIQVHANEK